MAQPYQSQPRATVAAGSHTRAGVLEMPRRRGTGAGTLLALLGIWGGAVPFFGPLFDYHMDSFGAGAMTWDRLWLSILPGIAVLLGGVLLVVSADRLSASAAAWLCFAGGGWFIVGPSFALLWGSSAGTAIGTGTDFQRFIEQIGYFYGLGAVVIWLAAIAWARLLVRSERDAAVLNGTPRGTSMHSNESAAGPAADAPHSHTRPRHEAKSAETSPRTDVPDGPAQEGDASTGSVPSDPTGPVPDA